MLKFSKMFFYLKYPLKVFVISKNSCIFALETLVDNVNYTHLKEGAWH